MNIEDQIQTLEELAAVDAELKILDDQIALERGTLSTLKGSLKEHAEKLATDQAHSTKLDKSRGDLLNEARTMMQQLDHSREKLNRSRNERESNAAQRELEELRKLVRDREDEIGKLTTEIDAARLGIEATEGTVKNISDELGGKEGDITASLRKVEKERGERAGVREAISKKLPPVIYRRYELIRSKRGTGIAQTTDGTCKACNMSLPPQLFHRLRRDPVIEQCPSCNRLIYFQPPQAIAATTST
ncbi:MAG: C4-type zinc ribbon domain-containing protein [Polyangiaceae bacterium]